MADRLEHLTLELDVGPDADAEEVDELTRRLRRELLELDVESVDLSRAGPPPPGARAVDVLSLGTLIVTLAKSSGALGTVVAVVRSWLSGAPRRTVKLELDGDVLEVSGVSLRDQRELIASWIARHEAAAG